MLAVDTLDQRLTVRPDAAVFLPRAVDADDQDILSGAQLASDVIGEWLKIAGMAAQLLAVQPDIGKVVNARKAQLHGALGPKRGRPGIPAGTKSHPGS